MIQENTQSINSTGISETSISWNEINFDNPIFPEIDPKIVPSSQISEHPESSSTHKCPYCNIHSHDIGFDNTDLLERHVIQRHAGLTAYPGQPDLEKYKRGWKGKKI